MKRFVLGLMAGLMAVTMGALLLWFVVPFIFSTLNRGSEAWLRWFPFVVLPPALVFGGFIAAYVDPTRRFALGFLVGAAAFSIGALFVSIAGQIWFLLLLVVCAGILSSIGASLVRKQSR